MIGKTERDEIIQGNNEPSGRLNLKGQKKPQYLIEAVEEEMSTWEKLMAAIDENDKLATKETYSAKVLADQLYNTAWLKLLRARRRFRKERKNESL